MRRTFITLAVALSAPAAAELYVCKEDGKMRFSSQPLGDHCVLQQSYEHAAPAVKSAPQPAAAPARKQNKRPPAAAPIPQRERPVVSAATQKERDKKRGEILRDELKKETEIYVRMRDTLLTEKEKAPQDAQYIAYLRQWVRIRAQNIKALRQELERL